MTRSCNAEGNEAVITVEVYTAGDRPFKAVMKSCGRGIVTSGSPVVRGGKGKMMTNYMDHVFSCAVSFFGAVVPSRVPEH